MQFHIASPLPEAPPKRFGADTAFLDFDSSGIAPLRAYSGLLSSTQAARITAFSWVEFTRSDSGRFGCDATDGFAFE
ncbi:hypothetical protein ACS3SW_15390 [Roseobacteraceae bacterium S113]